MNRGSSATFVLFLLILGAVASSPARAVVCRVAPRFEPLVTASTAIAVARVERVEEIVGRRFEPLQSSVATALRSYKCPQAGQTFAFLAESSYNYEIDAVVGETTLLFLDTPFTDRSKLKEFFQGRSDYPLFRENLNNRLPVFRCFAWPNRAGRARRCMSMKSRST